MNHATTEHDLEFDPAVKSWFVPNGQSTSGAVESSPQNSQIRSKQIHALSLMLHQPDDSGDEIPWKRPVEPNQRQFARCQIPQERATAKLIMNGRKFACQLVELSIGGFGVVVSGNPTLSLGAIGQLYAPGLNFIVSVSRHEERADGVYVGLKQLEEVLDDHPFGHSTGPTAMGYAIAAVAGALIATLAYFFMRGH